MTWEQRFMTGAYDGETPRHDNASAQRGLAAAALQGGGSERAQLQALVENLKSAVTPAAAAGLASAAARAKPLIMVVDDDDIMRKLMTKILHAQQYAVEAVSNAVAALRSLQTQLPDLILMDVQMPAIDGIELTRRLKEIEAYAGIPIVMLTGRGEQQIIDQCRDAGATDYLIKPFEREVLLQKLRQYLPQQGQ